MVPICGIISLRVKSIRGGAGAGEYEVATRGGAGAGEYEVASLFDEFALIKMTNIPTINAPVNHLCVNPYWDAETIGSVQGSAVVVVSFDRFSGEEDSGKHLSCEDDCSRFWFGLDWLVAEFSLACSRSLLISETRSSNPENPFPFFWSAISLFLHIKVTLLKTDLS